MHERARKPKDQRNVPATIEELYRDQFRRIFATLIRLIGDFDLAEEALQEAFATAQEKWTKNTSWAVRHYNLQPMA